MKIVTNIQQHFKPKQSGSEYRTLWQCLHLDLPLLLLLLALSFIGFIILYSVSNQNLSLVINQAWHIGLAYVVIFLLAQIPPNTYYRLGLPLYSIGIVLLAYVLIAGHVGLGAKRWINLGFINFQPSELMKLAIPMVLARWFTQTTLPPRRQLLVLSCLIIAIPALLTIKQPDLGTGIILIIAGLSTLLLAGMRLRTILYFILCLILIAPLLWHFMHDYQKQRILTFLSPERDPLGTGYHIVQSKIAIGSGGLTGMGFLHSPQANLNFLPEHTTDFIFAVFIQEFGLIGAILLIAIFLLIIWRCFFITLKAQETFSRLLAGSLTLTFFFSFFINMCMVCGLVPVVGVPLPLISYGGTAMVTMLANFGILMSIHRHRKLITT